MVFPPDWIDRGFYRLFPERLGEPGNFIDSFPFESQGTKEIRLLLRGSGFIDELLDGNPHLICRQMAGIREIFDEFTEHERILRVNESLTKAKLGWSR